METAEKKIKRSKIKQARKEAQKEAAKKGAAVAFLYDVSTSPRKMRLVADLIRGERVNKALNILKYEFKNPAPRLEKLLLSAISNWGTKNSEIKLEDADLYIKEIYVDGGRILKRLRTAPQGRAHRIRKRSNHVKLVVDRMPVQELQEKTPATSEKETQA